VEKKKESQFFDDLRVFIYKKRFEIWKKEAIYILEAI